jgi:hypothetical protein
VTWSIKEHARADSRLERLRAFVTELWGQGVSGVESDELLLTES